MSQKPGISEEIPVKTTNIAFSCK